MEIEFELVGGPRDGYTHRLIVNSIPQFLRFPRMRQQRYFSQTVTVDLNGVSDGTVGSVAYVFTGDAVDGRLMYEFLRYEVYGNDDGNG